MREGYFLINNYHQTKSCIYELFLATGIDLLAITENLSLLQFGNVTQDELLAETNNDLKYQTMELGNALGYIRIEELRKR